jgi:hypothetical protein
MPVAVTDLVMDVAITNFAEQRCEVLYSGPSHQPLTVDEGRYKKAGTVVRLHVCLMGETRPALSPLSVDVATDRDYCVYRYDWVFGIRGLTEWDWKSKLRDEALVVQLTMRLGAPNIGCTCVAAKLNVLPPSRDTSTWAERNPDTVVGLTKGAADLTAAAVGSPVVGIVTKVAAALSNSLASRGKRKTNWYLISIRRRRRPSSGVACQAEGSRRVRSSPPGFVDARVSRWCPGRLVRGWRHSFASEAAHGVPARNSFASEAAHGVPARISLHPLLR